MHAGQPVTQQSVPGHRKEHPHLAHEHDDQYAGDARHGAEGDQRRAPLEAQQLQCRGDRRIHVHLLPGQHAGEHAGHQQVEQRADHE